MKVDIVLSLKAVLATLMLLPPTSSGVTAFTLPSDLMKPPQRTRILSLSLAGSVRRAMPPLRSSLSDMMEGPEDIYSSSNNDEDSDIGHQRYNPNPNHQQQQQQLIIPSRQFQQLQKRGKIQQIKQQRQDWIDRSVNYYSKIMRHERRKNLGQIDPITAMSQEYQEDFHHLANKHYFALRKIKSGNFKHAELIYRKIIHDIMNEESDDETEQHCDHAKLAVTTLLLALHLQRMGDLKKTRGVFLQFFRIVVIENSEGEEEECACSAKVLGAYALFEMKQGLKLKSLEIAKKAIQFDHELEPVLQWKQFRDVVKRTANTDTNSGR